MESNFTEKTTEGYRKIAVKFDGSWAKLGFTRKYGAWLTGDVIDIL